MSLVRRYGRLKLVAAACDVLLLWMTAAGALRRVPSAWLGREWLALGVLSLLAVPLFRLMNLYKPRIWLAPASHVRRLVVGFGVLILTASMAVLALTGWPEGLEVVTGGTWVVLWGVLFVAARMVVTAGLLAISRITPVLSRRAVLVGAGEAAVAFVQSLEGGGLVGTVFEGALDDDPGKAGMRIGTMPVLGTMSLLPGLARRGVSEAYLAIDAVSHDRLLELIRSCQDCSLNVRLVSRHFAAVGSADWDRQYPNHEVVSLYARPLRTLQWRIKYLLDRVLASVALIVTAPLLLLIALLVRLTSPGPALYVSNAIGRGEHEFPFFKFRSMRSDVDESRHRELIDAIVSNPEARLGKLKDDDRVTPLGRWLRKSSIDELPQLINVLRGEMSLVGPRPSKPYELRRYQAWHRRRFAVLPGMTGLWQVSGRASVSFNEMVAMDLYYIENFSLWLDLVILLRTVRVVLAGRGAV